MYNCLENLVILQVKSQAYLFIRKGLMRRLVWVFVYSSDCTEISSRKKYNFFLRALLFS